MSETISLVFVLSATQPKGCQSTPPCLHRSKCCTIYDTIPNSRITSSARAEMFPRGGVDLTGFHLRNAVLTLSGMSPETTWQLGKRGRSCTDGDSTAISCATCNAVMNSTGFRADCPTMLASVSALASTKLKKKLTHKVHCRHQESGHSPHPSPVE